MGERRYTLAEIDAMRAALRRRHKSPFDDMDCYSEKEERGWQKQVRREVEDEIRTAMLGGVDPAELLYPYPTHREGGKEE